MSKIKAATTVAIEFYGASVVVRALFWILETISGVASSNAGTLILAITGIAVMLLVLLLTKSLVDTELAMVGVIFAYLITVLGGDLAKVVGQVLSYCVFSRIGSVTILSIGAIIGFAATKST